MKKLNVLIAVLSLSQMVLAGPINTNESNQQRTQDYVRDRGRTSVAQIYFAPGQPGYDFYLDSKCRSILAPRLQSDSELERFVSAHDGRQRELGYAHAKEIAVYKISNCELSSTNRVQMFIELNILDQHAQLIEIQSDQSDRWYRVKILQGQIEDSEDVTVFPTWMPKLVPCAPYCG